MTKAMFKRGQRVAIFNNRYPSGLPIMEGWATIQSNRLSHDGDEDGGGYKVRFEADGPHGSLFERYVILAAQADPNAYLEQLRASYHGMAQAMYSDR